MPNSNSDLVLIEQDQGVARLTLNRPNVGNALDVDMSRSLLEAAIRCDEDESIRCVLLTGAGKLFCAGGDVSSFAAAGMSSGALIKKLTAQFHMALTRFVHMNKPLVTAINGAAAGAGLSLAMLGDIAIAARSAHFTLAYTAIGLSPDGAATWLLPRLVGLRRAQELALTNKRLSADDAVAMDLITRAVDDEQFLAEAQQVAVRLAQGPTLALGRTRQLLYGGLNSSLEAHMDAEARSIASLTRTRHAIEGITAFTEKRKPDFSNL